MMERRLEKMNIHNFKLNTVFTENSKKYQSKPVRAAKYSSGMENGFMLYFTNKKTKETDYIYEGIKFFSTTKEARDYINAENKQYIKRDGKLVEILVQYDTPKPVLCRKDDNAIDKDGMHFYFKEYTFISDESCDYEFFVLEDDCWIIEADGNIRVWYPDSEETFFGKEKDIIYEVSGNEYIKIAV